MSSSSENKVVNGEVVSANTVSDNPSMSEITKAIESGNSLGELPSERVINDSKIFLVYYIKSRLSRILILTEYLDTIEDNIMKSDLSKYSIHAKLDIANSIRDTLSSTIELIKRINSDSNYINIIYNDNKNVVTNILSDEKYIINKDSREKLRKLTSNLLDELDK